MCASLRLSVTTGRREKWREKDKTTIGWRGPETQVLRAKCSNASLQARADCVRPSRVPTSITEIRTANRWGTINSKSLGPIIMMNQSETLRSSVRSYLVHTFLQVHIVAAPSIYELSWSVQFCWAKTSFLSRTGGICSLFYLQFYCAGSHTEHSWRCTKNNNMHANCKPSNCQHINPPSVKHPELYHQKWENGMAFESTWMQQCSWKLSNYEQWKWKKRRVSDIELRQN